jgi:hypothetical protein
MRASTHNVLLVNQISCSRGEERERERAGKKYDSYILPHIYLKLTYAMRERLRVCVHGPTQEKTQNKEI